jgi:hypothetical protein
MKETEASIDYEGHQVLLYVEKGDGEYGPLQTGSYLTKNYVDDFWEKQKNLTQSTTDRLCKGEISPVGYYMLMINISAGDLAARIGISPRKVRQHREPAHFAKIKISLLCKYAEVFGVSVANMFQILIPSNNKMTLLQKKTSNPFVITTAIIEEKK